MMEHLATDRSINRNSYCVQAEVLYQNFDETLTVSCFIDVART